MLIGIVALLGRGLGSTLIVAGLSAVVLAAFGLVISMVVHWRWGHGPTSTEPMDLPQFVGFHTAFLVAGVVIVIGLVVLLYARRRGFDA